MGCGNVFKKEEIQTKDVDLTFEAKKPHSKETSDSIFFDKRKTGDIVVAKRTNNANKNRVAKRKSINKQKHESNSNIIKNRFLMDLL